MEDCKHWVNTEDYKHCQHMEDCKHWVNTKDYKHCQHPHHFEDCNHRYCSEDCIHWHPVEDCKHPENLEDCKHSNINEKTVNRKKIVQTDLDKDSSLLEVCVKSVYTIMIFNQQKLHTLFTYVCMEYMQHCMACFENRYTFCGRFYLLHNIVTSPHGISMIPCRELMLVVNY